MAERVLTIFDAFGSIGESILAGRHARQQRSSIKIPPSTPQGEYPSEQSYLTWGYIRTLSKREFAWPGFNINDIDTAIGIDGVVNRAISRYIQLIFKEGYYLDGKNQKLVDYIKRRFAIFEQTSAASIDTLLRYIASDIVRYGNCIIVKSRYTPEKMPLFRRAAKQRLGRINIHGVTGEFPISGYWWQEFGHMKARVDPKGGIPIQYEQNVNNQRKAVWSAKDVVHLTMDRPAKSIWGRSFIVPVIDDIKVLRSMEEHAANLFYRYLNPLIHVAVGANDEEYARMAGEKEVSFMRNVIENTPPEGILVTDGRTAISQISGKMEGMNGIDYLNYFSDRVIIGLGVSKVVLGLGDSTNKSTADSLVSQMRDNILTIHALISGQFTSDVINELLDEIDVDYVDPKNQVVLTFREVDTDLQIKKDNNAIQKWINNVDLHSEVRKAMGNDPIPGGKDGLFKDIIEKEKMEFQGEVDKRLADSMVAKRNAVDNKARPANQHGKKLSPKRKEFLDDHETVRELIVEYLVNALISAVKLAEITNAEEIDTLCDITDPVVVMRNNLTSRGIDCKDEITCVRGAINAVEQYSQGTLDKDGMRKLFLEYLFMPSNEDVSSGEEDES